MELDDLIKILLLALFLLPGLLKKKKKKTAEENDVYEQETTDAGYNDPFEGFERATDRTVEVQTEEEGEDFFATEGMRHETDLHKSSSNHLSAQVKIERALEAIAREKATEQANLALNTQNAANKADQEKNIYLKDFDPRAAFIYSEIFNSKYI